MNKNTTMTPDNTADGFDCPSCGSSRIEHITNTEGTYECAECGSKTHEKIERQRDGLEELAESDNPAGKIARLMVGD